MFGVENLPKLFFGYFAVMITVLSLLVVTRKNLIHSIMWMLLLFIHIGGLYLFLNAEFLAAIQIIVYAGAILVLFLFVVLLLNVREEFGQRWFVRSWQGRGFIAAVLLLGVMLALQHIVHGPMGKYSIDYIQKETHAKVLGTALFNEYVFPFMIVALVLFVPMIAAVVLTIINKGRKT